MLTEEELKELKELKELGISFGGRKILKKLMDEIRLQ